MNYLKEKYNKQFKPELLKELGLSSVMAVPELKKVIVNVGLGEALRDKAVVPIVFNEVKAITGQQPVVAKAKVSVANFKLRQGDPIGVHVTLRGAKMWDFTAKVIDIVFPRIKDFRGFTVKSFDGRGNYTVGLEDQVVFFEIDPNKVTKLRGMEITFVTSARNNKEGEALLAKFGFPFKEFKRGKTKK